MRRGTLQYVNKHPLNRSKTKQAHSFSKSPRFKELSATYGFIDLSKSAVQLRPKAVGVKFTRQQRFNYVKQLKQIQQNRPSPQSYKSPNFFQQALKKKKGITIPHQPKLKTQISILPGPGSYQISKFNPQNNAYSISRQNKTVKQNWNKLGPGQYLKDNNSICKSSKNIIIGTQKRFRYETNHSPAPGQYSHTTSLFEQSNIYRKPPKFSFARSNRQSSFNGCQSFSPGPGKYEVSFSEFSQRSKRIFSILNRL